MNLIDLIILIIVLGIIGLIVYSNYINKSKSVCLRCPYKKLNCKF